MLLDFITTNNYQVSPITPAWVALKKTPDEYITWFQETRTVLEYLSQDRIETMVNNLLWYTGEYDRTLEYRIVTPGRSDVPIPRKILPRIFNHLHDITEQRVSKLSRLKPGFETVPSNREERDRLVARLMKTALEAMARRVHLEFLIQEVERWTSVFGECFIEIVWDEFIGDRKSKGSVERVGDVNVRLKAPWTVLPEPKRQWSDVKWVIDIESIMHIEEARKRFKDESIQPDGKINIFEFNSNVQEKREDEVVVYRVIIPPFEFCPEGSVRWIVSNKVVKIEGEKEHGDYPYSHFEFPFERHTDLDVPGRLFPMSFYQQIKPIQHVYNRLTSIMVRNAFLVGHPHILMPKGAAKIEAFGNAATAIEYNGQIEPKIATFSSIPQEFFQLRNDVRTEMGQVSGIQGVSRGAPPSGARAASMLRFYEEQEEQRASTSIIKHNELIRRVYLKAGSVIGDYYPTSSKDRLLRVVGKENEYDIEAFVGVKISAEYDVIIVNSTGFSESKALRLDEIERIMKIKPDLITDDQFADILEFKNVQKLYDVTTSAIKQAEDENEKILDGKNIPPPQKYQDLIAHWRTHMILMNSSTWENSVPVEIKDKMNKHMLATEMYMEEKAGLNATFASLLATLPGYPAFFNPTPQLPEHTARAQQPQMPPMAAEPAAGAAPGEPLVPEVPPIMPEAASVPSALTSVM